MTDAKQTPGFSFLLNDSAPAVEAEQRDPIDDLDLDMSDYGVAQPTHVPSPLPRPAVQEPQAVAEQRPGVRPLAEQPTTSESAAASPAEPAIKKIHFPARKPTKRPQQAFPAREAAATQPELAKAPTLERPNSAPKTKAPPRARAAPANRAAPTTRSAPATQLSRSLSRQAPRVADRDSSDDFEATGADHGQGQLDAPSDWDESQANSSPDEGWSSETPSAKEIWARARRVWTSGSKEALALGGQGLEQAGRVAAQLNQKMQARMAEHRRLKAEVNVPGEPECEASLEMQAPRPTGPSPVSRAILGLAKSTGRAVAAPASAIAAAVLVYLGGSHLLGVDGGAALSQATSGPDVVELGSLPNQKLKQADEPGPKQQDSDDENEDSEPGEMQSEVAPMPEGLSWPGKGLIEVVTSEDELIYVDGVFTGRGPLRRIPVTPGSHEIKIKNGGKERSGTVDVQADKNTRAVFKTQ